MGNVMGNRTTSPWTIVPRTIAPAPRQLPPRKSPPGQFSPRIIAQRTIAPRQLPPGQLPLRCAHIIASGKFPARLIDPLDYSHLGLCNLGNFPHLSQ